MSSKAPQIPSKVFSALSGAEIAEIIEKQIKTAMQDDDRFAMHLTYPVVEWKWELSLRFYPSNASGDRIVLELGGSAADKEADKESLGAPVVATLTGEEKTDQPDKTRFEHQLPISRPEKNKSGRFVDKPQPVHRPSVEVPELEDDL